VLAELRVQGLAVIRDARLELGPGLNVLTGETGAGKSLLVDALALLLGERATGELVRAGEARAVVEGAFEVDAWTHGRSDARTHRPEVGSVLERLGVEPDEGRLVLKREVQPGGRSRAWINGSPSTAGVLAEVGRSLVDLHGQHETQSLLRPDAQRDILDAFGDAEAEAGAVAEAFDQKERLAEAIGDLEARRAEALRRADYLKHVVDEIGRAEPRAGELESLEAEARRLAHAEELGRVAEELSALLEGDDRSAGSTLVQAVRLVDRLERIDPQGARGWRETLDGALVGVEELGRAVREYAARVDLDPERLAGVERRRDLLFRLDRKYGPGLERVLAALEESRRELELVDTAEGDLDELRKKLQVAEAELVARCRALSRKRNAAARRLGAAVTRHLATLGMDGAEFAVRLRTADPAGRSGAETIEFVATLNPGLGERPIARAASGGELSRLMLALKLELAAHDRIPTLVFDEVDQGIGGHIAGRIAEALARVADAHQVLVITHLPQIAAAASRHLLVSKAAAGGLASSDVAHVERDQRVEEIARMLGADETAATARRHAKELLKRRLLTRD
jgi:DNA repair protein RecN (Recombination protein N)